jgi:glucose/arabinose dehydrogenase
MRQRLTNLLWACATVIPMTLAVPSLAVAGTPSQSAPTSTTPAHVTPKRTPNTHELPSPHMVNGQPIETRPPEKSDDKAAFPGQTRAPYRATAPFTVTTLTDQLKMPWSLAFLPDGKFLITEKHGTMRMLSASGELSQPIAGVPAVDAIGQVGLLDVALDPHFASNKRIFFTYSEAVGDAHSNIVVARASFDEAAGALEDVTVIFRAKPDLPRTRAANEGGRIAIGRDGNLFVTIGDRSQSPPWQMAQKLDNDLGKIIHITPDGAPAPGNPFIGKPGALPEIWSYGHRSEEGLTINPKTGELWETEHGPRGGDEINTPMAGKNYGWPVIVHGIDYPGETIGQGITEKAGMEQPLYYWDPVIAPSGLAFYTGKLFPQWTNSLFVGALRGQTLDRLTFAGKKVVSEEPLLVAEHDRIRDVRIGPEGAVYVLTDSGKLLKLTPK